MNGYLSIELAHQHQQTLIEHAARTRLASRVAGTMRPASATRWRRRRNRSRGLPRYRSVGGAGGGGSPLAWRHEVSLLAAAGELGVAKPLNQLGRTERAERSGANE